MLGREVLAGITTIFKTSEPGRDLPGLRHGRLGGGARQHAVAGRPGADVRDRLVRDLWNKMATPARPRGPSSSRATGAPASNADAIEARLAEDKARAIKAVAVVHNETSTGVASGIAAVRRAIDKAGHPALLLVDTISSLGSIDYRHDEWGVDVTVGGSQKGLMLPPGLSFNAVSDKALAASKKAQAAALVLGLGGDDRRRTRRAISPTRRATNLLQGLKVALDMLHEEGLDNVFARHDRAAEATRRGGAALGLRDPVPEPRRVFVLAHRGAAAGRAFGRRLAGRDPRALQHVAWQRPRAARRPRVPHRPSRRFPRPHGHRHAVPASRSGSRRAASRTDPAASRPP